MIRPIMKRRPSPVSRPSRSFPGLFFAFEGGEGSGKSTQVRLLREWLEGRGIPVLVTREPGGTELGQTLRQLVLDHRNQTLSHRAELLLYEADRAQHVAETLLPALAAGKVVLSDRFEDSSTVYQGICRGLGRRPTESLNRFATGGLRPHLVFVLDIPEKEGIARARRRSQTAGTGLDRLEREALEFHRKVRRGFLAIARGNRRYRVLDARRSEAELAEAIRSAVAGRLERRGTRK
jgi:dTMP kinase